MPSNAYINFLHIRIDVLKLIETHSHYTQNKRGRKNLGFLTRSAVVMLCAAWERYNEDLLIESVTYLSVNVNDISILNKNIKKTISLKVRKDLDESKPIELAGIGWKNVWLNYAINETKLLNTPKSDKLKLLFATYLGIADYTSFWKTNNTNEIDDFVSDRGAIAHNGNKASYITMTKLRKYQDLVIENVIEIDSKMAIELKNMSGMTALPWVQDYYKEIERY
ncbi:HEPN domain-containing protein [Flavobacterium tructae]|uniref:HEPN domain-containing protein n=1 Tax=Flavobacterium tructae TaxID=1114873 RepID=UPI002551EA08|nr:HEPN domain-containing protein [Flavobacterium tructae]MDL2141190.1 HEPN domain-containing protein [Flavobacterium tructae]